MDNLQTLTAAGLVGQQVRVAVDSLQLGKQPLQGQFNLEHASKPYRGGIDRFQTALKTTLELGARRARPGGVRHRSQSSWVCRPASTAW